MAKEVTAWRIDRRQAHEQRRRDKVPPPETIDMVFECRKGESTLLCPESVAGEEWLLQNVGGDRTGRSFVIAETVLPQKVEAAEAKGLVVHERKRSI